MGGESRSGPHSTRSNPQIDPMFFQLLYEIDRRLDERFKEAREQNKEDMKAALVPVSMRLDGIDKRLDEGKQEFKALWERGDDHSGRIDAAKTLATTATATAAAATIPGRKPETALEKRRDSWVSKLGEKVILPLVVSALSIPAGLWVMLQFKLIAWGDTTPPAVAQPAKPPGTPP